MPNLKSVIEHRRSVHNIKRRCLVKIKDINIEPDIHDPNFYCKSCEVRYSSRNSYRDHLRIAHYMVLLAMPKRKVLQNTIVPDPDDPNQYCRACDYVYSSKLNYKYHCRYVHGMASVKIAKRRISLNGIIDTYCKLCDVRLASKTSYKSHLFAIHKLDWRQIHQEPKNIIPDVGDPNFYCRACETKLSSKQSFKSHLILIHSIHQSAPKKTSQEPDTEDPNNNCRACQKSFRTRNLYRAHLRLVHQITLPPLQGNINHGHLPDPNDSQNLNGLNTGIIIEDEKCEVCNKDENEDSLLLCDNRAFHTYCLNPPHSSVPELDWDSFEIVAAVGKDYDFKDGKEYNLKDFQAVCDDFKTNHFKKTHPEGSSTVTEDECERKFWKLVGDPNETCQVEYGVDLHGSGFSTANLMSDPWNLNAIPVAAQSLFRGNKSNISSLMPRLYAGMCFSAFGWRNKDYYTGSVSYMHWGETKTCPERLKKENINVYAVDQRPGQFVVVYPLAYHSGFNHGFNMSETVNFANRPPVFTLRPK
ncbi:hypothetical protein G6F42_014758 [Rhizopus arrhizus]|nr:hypothetical protein G6F42_014758 [Rhizopus arrhizus]